ncbi:MetQ/NlpA family ABC transporter substrate-binding protein [Microaerobacter geothermalis]|uniref:MetQ/NlpA family ABC transporter substrate-binding protein n=1 Tax=Microaerobacter geothermalis TaxID=674972 RepID=UPI001F3F3DCE|nr:MetQ/NlpA family ABC transporter substrate-binding protein [Microaerobacter geothermalis]MCF6092378.1 MetQ/NlpA family ABC transporter substrate-binding protein [Microaerobacter geothermalis]
MKKFGILAVLVLALTVVLAGCGGKEEVLKVGATAVPHAEVLNEVVKPALEKEGIKLEVVVLQDYVTPNTMLAEKELDANYFQHIPWLENTNKEKGLNLIPLVGVHIEPMGAYSNKEKAYQSIDELPNGATVAVTNSSSEIGRVLALLEANGLIKLKDGVGINGQLTDIVENPKNLKFTQLDPAMLPRAIEDPKVDLAVINTNFALQANLVPAKDALILEDADSPYVNVLAIRPDNKEDARIQKLAEVLLSEEVKTFIEEKYAGAVVPAQKKYE